jgi:hypothetical protein
MTMTMTTPQRLDGSQVANKKTSFLCHASCCELQNNRLLRVSFNRKLGDYYAIRSNARNRTFAKTGSGQTNKRITQKRGNIFWLSDLADGKQDAIPVFTAQAFGPERVSDLAKAAEAAEDWWLASLRWSASALSGGKTGF